jgi:arylformamidase
MGGTMTLYDVSLVISEEMPIWPGDPLPEITKISLIENGELANTTKITSCVHVGTHVDAPDHFLNNGSSVEEIPLDLLVGNAQVVEIDTSAQISAEDLRSAGVDGSQERLLIKTSNSDLWSAGVSEFQRDFIALEPDAAAYLVKNGVKVIGVDYLSVAPFADPAPTHQILLEADILIIEGLNLSKVPAGEYRLYCLPLKIKGADGAPARVLLEGQS